MNLITVALLLLTSQPVDGGPLVDMVDLTEIDHVYDNDGVYYWTVISFLDWIPESGRYEIRDSRRFEHISQRPKRNFSRGGYDSIWQDGIRTRQIWSADFEEKWTQHDIIFVPCEGFEWAQQRGLRQLIYRHDLPTPPTLTETTYSDN